MKCLSKSTSRVDIIASHDWPVGIEQYGNTQELIRQKPFFREEIEQNNLGSPPNREVLDTVKPAYWFSAHLHVKFFAKVDHQRKEASIDETSGGESAPVHLIPSQVRTMASVSPLEKSSDERAEELVSVAAVEDGGSLSEAKKPSTPTTPYNDNQQQTMFHGLESTCVAVNDLAEQMTRFLALDKCLPRRKYLSILHIESPTSSSRDGATLEFDPEWLAVLRKTHHLNTTQRRKVNLPDDVVEISKEEIAWVEERLKEKNSRNGEKGGSTYRAISTDFQPTVPFYSDPMFQSRNMCPPFPAMGNPQTDFLLDVLELDHSVTHPYDRSLTPQRISESLRCLNEPQNLPMVVDENEIDLEGDDEKEIEDENEIEIDDDNDQVDDTTPASPSKPSQPDTAITKKPRIDG
jgi:lariat debranching enzyme